MSSGNESADPRLIEVITKRDGFLDPVGPLHRLDSEKQCGNIPTHNSKTDLVTAVVGDGHELCDNCEWPEGAQGVVEDGE